MPFSDHVEVFFVGVNAVGMVAFAASGAVAAIRRDADFFGVLVLAVVASSFGGIFRDILIGALPPDMLRTKLSLAIALGTGTFTYFCYPLVNKLTNPMEVFDAFGLGLFAVIGANKALNFGIDPVWAVGLGLLTAVGGGIVRDMILAQVPTIIKSEIYATAALAGAIIMVAGKIWFPTEEKAIMLAGAFICTGMRLLALHFRWHMPL